MKVITNIKMAVDEIFLNIILYSGASIVEIECSAADGRAGLTFTDDGKSHNPLEKADPDVSLDV